MRKFPACSALRRLFRIVYHVACCSSLVTAAGAAQELRGAVLLPDRAGPASGIVAVLLHPTRDDSIVARAVTNERGRFVLKAPAATPVRLRFLRIGYEAVEAGSFSLAAGEIRDTSFTLTERRVQLAAMDVKAAGRCDVQPKGAMLVAQLFDQARTALIATTADVADRQVVAQFVDYRRQQDRRGRLSAPVARFTRNAATLRPYASVDVDSLERIGYMSGDGEVAEFFAPDANVLISDKFLLHHCLQLVTGKDSLSTSIGIGFLPVGKRPDIVDVKGTLWLDRATSELQFLEYTYESLPSHLRTAGLGGRVDYAHTPDGVWFISEWMIRMPMVTTRAVNVSTVPGIQSYVDRPSVTGYVISGGAVEHIRQVHEVLYLNYDAHLAGATPDDADDGEDTQAPRADTAPARTAATVGVNTSAVPAIDSSTCVHSGPIEFAGVLHGRVLDKRSAPLSHRVVRAQWNDSFEMTNTNTGNLRWRIGRVESESAADGSYALCGVPYNRALRVQVGDGSTWNRGMIVRVAEAAVSMQVDLVAAETGAPAGASPTAALPANALSANALSANALSANALTAGALSTDTLSTNARHAGATLGTPERPAPPTLRPPATSALNLTDVNGWPVPYAVAEFAGAVPLVADVDGLIVIDPRTAGGASTNGMLNAVVRRSGYSNFRGIIVGQSGNRTFLLSLSHANVAPSVSTADITSRLEAAGFYQRLLAAQATRTISASRGAEEGHISAEFITPEELDENRNVALSQLFAARSSLRVTQNQQFTVLRGNTGCVMSVVVNGVRVGDIYDGQNAASNNRTIDDVVRRENVRAIEIYADAASVPTALRPALPSAALPSAGGATGCGMVALWADAK